MLRARRARQRTVTGLSMWCVNRRMKMEMTVRRRAKSDDYGFSASDLETSYQPCAIRDGARVCV